MEKRNRYRNRVRSLTICRLVVGGLLLLGMGAGFVLVRNQHILRGNEIRELEENIVELDREIEMWELRIAAVRDRQELSRRLRWVQSDLDGIDTARVIELQATREGDDPVADIY